MGRFHPLGRRTPGIVYDARLLDERGDQTGHKESMRKVNSPPILKPITPLVRGLSSQPSGMEDVRQFCRWAATNGVRVVAVPPPLATNPAYAQPAATQVQAQVKAFYQGIGIPFLGVQTDWLYPVNDFYDTNYHLTEEAARRHSQRLALRLRTWFASGQ